jgi:hypothetical protein
MVLSYVNIVLAHDYYLSFVRYLQSSSSLINSRLLLIFREVPLIIILSHQFHWHSCQLSVVTSLMSYSLYPQIFMSLIFTSILIIYLIKKLKL